MAFDPKPTADPLFRRQLLDHYIEGHTSSGLADWLRDLGQDTKGTLEERKARVLAHTMYLTMPAEGFPKQTRNYLADYDAGALAHLCDTLGLSDEGTKDSLYRRIFREVGIREGWLPRLLPGAPVTVEDLSLYLAWYPISKRGSYEKDYYPTLFEELAAIYGEQQVHEQLPIAHGTTLKIDFHVGHPQASGIGLEVKMPTNNSEIQRCLGQIDQYLHRYDSDFLLLLLPDFMDHAALTFMTDQLAMKRVRTIVKAP